MGLAEAGTWALAQAAHELALFAAIGMAIGGLDDLIVDLIWLARSAWRRATIYSRYRRATARDFRDQAGRVAVFVPVWREVGVIGPMAAAALARWAEQDVLLFIGCYPNDQATLDEVRVLAAHDARVRLVINPRGIM